MILIKSDFEINWIIGEFDFEFKITTLKWFDFHFKITLCSDLILIFKSWFCPSLNIVNLYIPPTSSTPARYTTQLDHLNSWNNTYILGDLNAHNPSWLDAQTTDLRGTQLLQQLDTFMILNNTSTPTRLPYNIHNQPTSPDVSLATSDLGLRSTWRAGHELSSNHRPLYISLTIGIPIQRRPNHTFTNYKHADWHNFSATIEDSLQSFDISQYNNIDSALQHLNNVISTANKRHIPSGN